MRYTLIIPDKLSEVFKQIANEEQISQSELMKRSLLTYCVLHKEISMGKSIAITKNGIVEKELLLII